MQGGRRDTMPKEGTIISQTSGAKAVVQIGDRHAWRKRYASPLDLGDSHGEWIYSDTNQILSFYAPNGKDFLFWFLKVPTDFLTTYRIYAGEGSIVVRGSTQVREDIFWKIGNYLSAAVDSGDADDNQSDDGADDQSDSSDTD
jgi:hypothetical protein